MSVAFTNGSVTNPQFLLASGLSTSTFSMRVHAFFTALPTGGSNSYADIFGRGSGTSGPGVSIFFSGGSPKWSLGDFTTDNPATTGPTASTWYCIHWTQNGTAATLYINGVAVKTATLQAATAVALLAAYQSGNSSGMAGLLAHAAVWDRVLTAAEVAQDALVLRPPSGDPREWHPFFSNNATEWLSDYSGNARTGSANGTTLTGDPRGPALPWRGRRNRITYVTVGGGGPTTYSYTGTGGLSFGGVAPKTMRARVTGTGPLTFGGTAGKAFRVRVAGTGGLAFGGLAPVRFRLRYIPTGPIVFGGSSPSARRYAYVGHGGLVLAGTGPARFSAHYVPTGSLSFGGAAALAMRARYLSTGGTFFGGAATVSFGSGLAQHYSYTGHGGMVFGGGATITYHHEPQIVYERHYGPVPPDLTLAPHAAAPTYTRTASGASGTVITRSGGNAPSYTGRSSPGYLVAVEED